MVWQELTRTVDGEEEVGGSYRNLNTELRETAAHATLIIRQGWSGGIGRRSRLKICRRSPGMGVQLPPPAPTFKGTYRTYSAALADDQEKQNQVRMARARARLHPNRRRLHDPA